MKRLLTVAAVLSLSVLSAYAQENSAPPPSDAPWTDMARLCAQRGSERFYPQRALQRGQPGDVVLDCSFNEDGSPHACQVVSEDPARYDFGRAALRIACRTSLTGPASETPDASYYTPEGETLTHRRWTVRFRLG
ncbi:TonB family protein [Terricaulis sp.]|uniref:TonB family protein n=1 Tax=Terricaulis sp. TaxID=2768686 RepID=UPI003783952F